MKLGHAEDRFRLWLEEHLHLKEEFRQDVIKGLTHKQKNLPPKYFYDERGSRLFDQICELPEYYQTRTELKLLKLYSDQIIKLGPAQPALIELGSGSSLKTRQLIEKLLEKDDQLTFFPIDISTSALRESSRSLIGDYPELRIEASGANYIAGIENVRTIHSGPKILIWLGSSIGNLEPEMIIAFLRTIRTLSDPEDRFLIGFDLIKDISILEAAYNDAMGITEQFNLNLLQRLNREFDGDFDLDTFRHRAIFNKVENRIEIYLDSVCEQSIRLNDLDLTVPFYEGESIHTENSYKFSMEQITSLSRLGGFDHIHSWTDDRNYFNLSLFQPK